MYVYSNETYIRSDYNKKILISYFPAVSCVGTCPFPCPFPVHTMRPLSFPPFLALVPSSLSLSISSSLVPFHVASPFFVSIDIARSLFPFIRSLPFPCSPIHSPFSSSFHDLSSLSSPLAPFPFPFPFPCPFPSLFILARVTLSITFLYFF